MHAARQDGFADIHSHVLYGMDDGARTRDDSLRMLELAARSGTTDIVATPHANSRYRSDPDLIDAQIADLTPRSPASACCVQVTAGSFGGRFGKGARDCVDELLAA